MTKKEEEKAKALSWKLRNLPTVEEVQALLKDDIITKEEARQILFKEVNPDDKIKLLEDEVELLKDVVKRLTERQPIQTIVKYVETWPTRYYNASPVWMSSTGTTYGTVANNVVSMLNTGVSTGAGVATTLTTSK